MAMFKSEVINTKHWIPTGKFRLSKKTKQMEEIKRPVVHRRVFLTANGVTPVGLVKNIRIVRVSRHGEITYSLSGRKETQRAWWEKNANGVPLAPILDKKYTKIGKSMTQSEVIAFLTRNIDNPLSALEELDSGEPMDSEDGQNALLRYGYEEYEWVEAKAA